MINHHSIDKKINFEKVTLAHQSLIFGWLAEPHMQEFWDNSQEHKDDIIHFISGRPTPSSYFDGIFTYWVGLLDNIPFSLIMTAEVISDEEIPSLWKDNLSKTGATYSLDFGIGNPLFLGKKLAAPTLEAFTQFFQQSVVAIVDTFFIDPDLNNPRAIHVYEKAGFKKVGNYQMKNGFFEGHPTILMVKKM